MLCGGDREGLVQGGGRRDVDGVNVRIFKQLLVAPVCSLNALLLRPFCCNVLGGSLRPPT